MKKLIAWLFLFGNIALLSALWWSNSSVLFFHGGADLFIALARITGLLGGFLILIELILIGRVVWLEQIFGFDGLNKLHRWIGYGIGVFFLAHPTLVTIGYAMHNGVSSATQFFSFFDTGEYIRAVLGLIVFIVVIIISFPIVRKRFRYETWYFLHLLVYLAIGLVLGHQTFVDSGDVSQGSPLYYWFALTYGIFAIVLAYRWIKPLYLFRKHRFAVNKVVVEAPGVYSVHITGNFMDSYKFQPGQFAYLTFLKKGMWFTHPFSFSAAPNGKYLRFTMKGLGDFTNRIQEIPPNTRVIIDGPLGVFTMSRAVTDKYLFVGGGIGVTPIRAMSEVLMRENKDIMLLYGCQTESDVVFAEEFNELRVPKKVVLSRANDKESKNYEHGFINWEIISRLVPDVLERDIYMCGPPIMMRGLAPVFAEKGVPKEQIHFENFSF